MDCIVMPMHRWRRRLLLAILLPLYVLLLTYLSLGLATIIVDPIDGWHACFRAVYSVAILGEFRRAIEPFSDGLMWLYFAGPAILVSVTQALFLAPVLVARPRKSASGHSLLLSFIMAGLVGAGLATGLFLALAQLVGMWAGWKEDFIGDSSGSWYLWLGAPLVISWVFWSAMIASFAKRQRNPSVLRRLIGWLLGATLIEIIVVLPLDIMVRRRTHCYCGTATGHTMGLAAWAGLWLAGPGIILAILSKRRRLWWETNCVACGYDKGPSPGAKCPECGFEWNTREAASGGKGRSTGFEPATPGTTTRCSTN